MHAAIFDVSAFYIASLQSVTQCRSVHFFQAKAFDPETVREMSLALESVCSSLGLKVIDDPATRLVAEKIIALSQHGARGVLPCTVREFKSE